MKQCKFKLNFVAIAAMLAMASPLAITPTHAASTANTGTNKPTKTVEIAHTEEADKPAATNAVKNSRATRNALHSAVTTEETIRQSLRQKH